MLKKLFLKTFSVALNKVLTLDPETFERLKQLGEKTIEVDILNIKRKIFLLLSEKGFAVVEQTENIPDIVLRGTTHGFMKLRQQAHVSLYKSDVKIIGDMGLADEMRKLFSQLDLDWEGGLAEYTGDIAAHEIGKLVRGGLHFLKRTRENLQQTSKEYWQEEIRILPTRDEMEKFSNDVSKLRDDVERLQVRLSLK